MIDLSAHPKLNCPRCGKELPVDSVRENRDGRKRIYWECDDCQISIMDRGTGDPAAQN